jgi:hypothetical protein
MYYSTFSTQTRDMAIGLQMLNVNRRPAAEFKALDEALDEALDLSTESPFSERA